MPHVAAVMAKPDSFFVRGSARIVTRIASPAPRFFAGALCLCFFAVTLVAVHLRDGRQFSVLPRETNVGLWR